ncbi:MAG: MobF family relaxase [Rickettsiales bacterium]
MLSTKVFSYSSNAQNYYSHADYYGAEAKGIWYGEGTKDLNVSGEFDAKDSKEFRDILDGKMPNGQQLGTVDDTGELKHRSGVDLTFSSPKSLSIQMHVFADKEERSKLQEARMNALKTTLKYIEQSGLVYTRKGKGGVVKEPIHKLSYALFEHTTNRKLEPQDHVHCFLANAVKCKDGKFGSITLNDLFQNTKFLGQIFRNELALEVQKQGYKIRTTMLQDGSSSFELRDVSQKLIDAFSTRRKEIEELCKKYGVTTKEGRDKIVINSRESKKNLPESHLKEAWYKVANNVAKQKDSINYKSLTVSDVLDKAASFYDSFTNKSKNEELKPDDKLYSPDYIARLSLADVTYNQSVFTREDICKRALKYSIGKHSLAEINKSVGELIKAKEIIPSVTEKGSYTSKELLSKEKYIISTARKGIDSYASIVKKEDFSKQLASHERARTRKYPLNDQQIKAINHVLTSRDKVTAIQGLPGVGKSTVLETVRAMSRKKVVVDLFGAAPTASASKTLKESSGIESRTLHSFIKQYRGFIEGRGTEEGLKATQDEYKKGVVFVDESSLIGTRQMFDLLRLSEILKFRVVLVGDTKQLSSVEAGKPFEQLLDVIKSVKLDKIVRQKEESHKEAIKAVAKHDVLQSFKIHESNIRQSGKHFVNESIKKYVSLSSSERDKTILISPTREHRDRINSKIVESLSKTNEIKSRAINHSILKQVEMKQGDYNYANSYKEGQIIRFFKDYKGANIKKGEYLELKKVNDISNTLIFRKGLKTIRFQLTSKTDYSNKLEVFDKDSLKLSEGIKIRITKNDRDLVNSETATVKSVSRVSNSISLKLEDSSTKTLPLSKLKHIDYGYCSTVHSSQGKTTDRLIAAICSHKHLNDQKSWLVTISRHKNDLHVYMDDKKEVEKQYVSNKGKVMSSTETLKGLNKSI